MQLAITQGLPLSGKSTFCEYLESSKGYSVDGRDTEMSLFNRYIVQ